MVDWTKNLYPFHVSENLTIKTELPEDGADDDLNASGCQFDSVTFCTKNGVLKVGLIERDIYL